MKKTFLLLLVVLCFAACKKEPDLPVDLHDTLMNPFIGVWKAEGEYWQFRPDGTGGRAASATGAFPDDFSFLVYAGQDVRTTPSEGRLVILDDTGGASLVVTRYEFLIKQNKATLTPDEGSPVILKRVSGVPSVLNLKNQLIGEWLATWTGDNHDGALGMWSLKYRTDGMVKTYHHGMHQFENGYALRGNILVIFGKYRFSIAPVTAEIDFGSWQVNETQINPPSVKWVYKRVIAAEWKE